MFDARSTHITLLFYQNKQQKKWELTKRNIRKSSFNYESIISLSNHKKLGHFFHLSIEKIQYYF